MKKVLERLISITTGCRDDMHEPDEQGISARVIGENLDNAWGESIEEKAILNGYQEFVVIIRRKGSRKTEKFNLADLIALARKARFEE